MGKRARSIAVNRDVVRRLMRERGYNCITFGEACGYSGETVQQYVRNARMSPEMFDAMVNLLRVTPEELRGAEK